MGGGLVVGQVVRVRPAIPADAPAISTLAVATGLLTGDEASSMASSVKDGSGDEADWLIAVSPSGGVLGAAYFAPEEFSAGVWNLYFIAVDPEHQASGVGTVLLGAVESGLASRSETPARALVIETSSLDGFTATRAFYARRGYANVGNVPDYYGPGDDKVIFWKALTDPHDH